MPSVCGTIFHDGAYIMSYGPDKLGGTGRDRLSDCHAEALVAHPYFNPNIPVEVTSGPTFELISSPVYPKDAASVSVQLNVSDPDGLHQVILFATTRELTGATGFLEVIACRGMSGQTEAIVKFDYDGAMPSSVSSSLSDAVTHPMWCSIVDMYGDATWTPFVLGETLSIPYRHAHRAYE